MGVFGAAGWDPTAAVAIKITIDMDPTARTIRMSQAATTRMAYIATRGWGIRRTTAVETIKVRK
jgi:hypothetical protein